MVGRDHDNNTDNERHQQDDKEGDGEAPNAETVSTLPAGLATDSGKEQPP